MELLGKYSYTAITVTLTGNYHKIYERFAERNNSPDRHPGHVVNDCYPPKAPNSAVKPISYEKFVNGIMNRGMDSFAANGPQIVVDTTDFSKIHTETLIKKISDCRDEILLRKSSAK